MHTHTGLNSEENNKKYKRHRITCFLFNGIILFFVILNKYKVKQTKYVHVCESVCVCKYI